MSRISHERALWLSKNILPHEPALRTWLTARRVAGLDIDDIVQEAYAKLSALESTDTIKHPKSYFFRTAYSIIVTHVRRSRIVSIGALNDLDALCIEAAGPSPERQLEDQEQLRRVAEAIASLPETCRRVFILRRIDGLSQRAVAKTLGLSENTVEHHMTKGIRLLMYIFGRGGKPLSQTSIGAYREIPVANDQAPKKPRY